ncbi:GDP-D-glucose phosphorylase 1 [Corythoichthys intestinalis]|uniref:GDP-D-glucose phosphorylase 1 n=1 Tax=Corythoichthys intestinalis TaxID=161448 RepID=UPI0025A65CA2|nr:GDP-D-glucose phosphorylase 1 [Corythoichthys intestinalis]XP_061813014.1 GDP-D-glucose phosphorylase 1-like [Nerophis lumbriciformis]
MPTQFFYGKQDFVGDVRFITVPQMANKSRFDSAVQAGWTDRMERGLLRYTLGDLQTRILPGSCGFVAQLNVKRGIERRKPQEILSIKQVFNANQFNFNKINPDEIIFEMIKDCDEEQKIGHQPCKIVVLVNVSPLEFGHCLFVPDPTRCFPQVLTRFSIQVGIESVLLSSDPAFRVGFNSLGAFASVNHLHLHGYYLKHKLNIESLPCRPVLPGKGFHTLTGFPSGFLFYTESECVEVVANTIGHVTDFLVEANVAHNLFMTRGCPPCEQNDNLLRKGVRIAVWPRVACFGTKEESALNVALCELAGHLPFKNKKDFELATESHVIEIIQRYLLPHEDFLQLEKQLTQHLMIL